jgi:hypothetical protein
MPLRARSRTAISRLADRRVGTVLRDEVRERLETLRRVRSWDDDSEEDAGSFTGMRFPGA